MDSSNTVVREFTETGVNKPAFTEWLPPFRPGTYRLNVTITDKRDTAVVLNHFPPMNVTN